MTSFQINWRSVDLAMTEYVTSDYHKKHTKKYVQPLFTFKTFDVVNKKIKNYL